MGGETEYRGGGGGDRGELGRKPEGGRGSGRVGENIRDANKSCALRESSRGVQGVGVVDRQHELLGAAQRRLQVQLLGLDGWGVKVLPRRTFGARHGSAQSSYLQGNRERSHNFRLRPLLPHMAFPPIFHMPLIMLGRRVNCNKGSSEGMKMLPELLEVYTIAQNNFWNFFVGFIQPFYA